MLEEKNPKNMIFSEIDQDPGFKEAETEQPIIKVVGVGGGGNNAINHMFEQNISGVSFCVINTDKQALLSSPVPHKVLIGPTVTGGLGAGNDPARARAAAEESADEISQLFDDGTKMVFITAGMGGGTGTGAAPVVAKIARDKGMLTIGIVTIPFLFESRKKILKALQGADEMYNFVDALLIINNERLTEIYPDLNFQNAFAKADDTLSVAARSISEIITVKGQINLDFNDVHTTLRDGGVAIISSGYSDGENRVTKAIQNALNSPLLKNRDVSSSKHFLMNLYISPENQDFKMAEMNECTDFMAGFRDEVDTIWGWAYDSSLAPTEVKVTILAAGFEMEKHESAPQPAASQPKPEEPKKNIDIRRMEDEYGSDKIRKQEEEALKSRFVILTPEDYDNEGIIDLVERTPAAKRDNSFKQKIVELRKGAPMAAPMRQQPGSAYVGGSEPAQPRHNTTQSIDFGM